MPKSFYKHKLLFDENMPPRQRFPSLNEHFDVKHVSHDYNKGGIVDEEVYKIAYEQGRIIITINRDDFEKLIGTKDDYGVIAVSDGHKTHCASHASRPQLLSRALGSAWCGRTKEASRITELEDCQLTVFLLLLSFVMEPQDCFVHNPCQ